MVKRNTFHCVLRVFLGAALFLLPSVASLQQARQAEGSGVGMGARLPVMLETVGKRLGLNVSSQARPDGVSFEVTVLGTSAILWRLAGRFLRNRPTGVNRNRLISFGRLQLEGG